MSVWIEPNRKMLLWKYLQAQCIFFCILSVSADFCEEQWQVKIADDPSKVTYHEVNNHVEAIGALFDNTTSKKIRNKYILCPCVYIHCMHRCSNLDHENGASFKAIKQAVRPFHHYNAQPCTPEKCSIETKAGYMTLHGNKSKSFFEFIYTIDEPNKFDVGRVHEYTVKPNESFPLWKYDTNPHYCFTVENEKIEIYSTRLYAISSPMITAGMFTSVLCLALLLTAFVISRETVYIHGKCIACQAFSLLIAFMAMGMNRTTQLHHNNIMCYGLAYVAYFFFMGSFFWLNVMCFDMFWTFSINLKTRGASTLKRFKLYSIYAWLGSCAMTTSTLVATFALDASHPLFLDIGEEKCSVDDPRIQYWGKVAFFHGPLMVLLLVNLAFFIITLIKITSTQNMLNDALRMGSSNAERIRNKSNLVLNVKLFAIMGGFWIMESVSFFDTTGRIHEAFWIAFDMLNVLRGLWLLIFCVFLSKRVRTALWRKLFCVSVMKKTTASGRRNTATVIMSKGSQSDQYDQVEMRTLVANNANNLPPSSEETT